jgi:hypothetical protein
MISNKPTHLKEMSSNIEKDLKFINTLVSEQRLTNNKSIKKLHQEHKKHLHISEYKLIVGLLKGLEFSLMIEYLNILNNSTDTYYLFDAWAMDKLVKIYHQTPK